MILYLRIQGNRQLHIAEKKSCLVVWTSLDIPLKVERIERDEEFWNMKMFPFLFGIFIQATIIPGNC